MKKKQKIQLMPSARIPCMRVWCGHCKTVVKACRENGEQIPLSQCAHIDQLSYRAVVFIPNTRQRVVRSLGKNFNEAIKQLAILRQKIESGEVLELKAEQNKPKASQEDQVNKQTKPVLLINIFAKYLAALRGQGIANHLKLVRSVAHVRDVKNCFKQFCIALRDAKYELKTYQLSEISDAAVGAFHDRLIAKEYSNPSYNRFFSHLTTFASWAEQEEYGSVKRFFERVPRKTVTPRPEIITKEQFEKVLSVISHDSGFEYGIGKKKETRNHFREYLVPSFNYALITGRRVEEILTSRFSDMHLNESGHPLYITFTDHKVSRIMHVAPGEERKLYTPVTNQIFSFLLSQGFEDRKNTSDFILAPEIRDNRIASMRQAISRGFSHYWNVAFPDAKGQRSFKHLRKSYLTALASQGKNVREVSGHASDQILKSYVDEKQVAIANSLKDFSVYGSQPEKKEELKNLRRDHESEKSIGYDPP